jgi:hypothetical protein
VTPELPLGPHPWGLFALAPGLLLGPQPCNPFALVANPKLGLQQVPDPKMHMLFFHHYNPAMKPTLTTWENVQSQQKHINYVEVSNTMGQQNPNSINTQAP